MSGRRQRMWERVAFRWWWRTELRPAVNARARNHCAGGFTKRLVAEGYFTGVRPWHHFCGGGIRSKLGTSSRVLSPVALPWV